MNKAVLSIVSFNQVELLRRCLGTLLSDSLPNRWDLIVVDNNSFDGSAEMVDREYPCVKLIRNDINLGFGGGHNLSWEKTESEIFFVLNPDILVRVKDLDSLMKAFEYYPRASVIGPKLLNPDGSVQYSARRFYNWRTILGRRVSIPGAKEIEDIHLMKDCDLSQTQPVDWVMGAVMAIRREAFQRRDLFDPRYKLYFEDVDLCYFTQTEGWQVLYYPECRIIHDHQRTSARGKFNKALLLHLQSWWKFYWKTVWYRIKGEYPIPAA